MYSLSMHSDTKAFLCQIGISRNYFQRPEESATFIGDDGSGWDGEEPIWKVLLVSAQWYCVEQPEVESTDVLAPTPLRSVPGATVEPPRLDATSVGSSEDADVAGAESGSTSTEEETPDAPPTLAAKEVTETPPPNVEATSDSSAPVTHVVQSPPQTSPLTADDISRRDRETGPKAFEGMPVDQLMKEFDMSVQRMKRFCTAEDTVASLCAGDASESSRSYAQKLARGKNEHWACQARGGLISHGLRLAAMSALESQEVKQSFGDVVKCALARGKAEAVEELHEKKLLTVPVAQIPLKESLEAHAIRLAKKKGVKGKAILCGVGAAHIPRSDGVPVSVATVSPKDSELLGKLKGWLLEMLRTKLAVSEKKSLSQHLGFLPCANLSFFCVIHNGTTRLSHNKMVYLIPVIVCDAFASIPFSKVAIVMIRIAILTHATGKGPAMSIPHLWNGHGEVMGVSSCCGWLGIGLCTGHHAFLYHVACSRRSAWWASSTQTVRALATTDPWS
ncbi:hypothetical protein Tco_0476096 [Tanacetum coccineum]